MDTKEILGYAAGSIGSAVLAVIILPLLSWYFPADDIGRIVLMQTAAGLAMSVLCLGLDQAYIREYNAAADKDILFKALFLPPLLSAAAIAAFLLSHPALPSEILFSLDDAAAGIGLVLFGLSLLPIRFLLLVLRMEGRALAFSSAQLVPKSALLLLLLTVWLLHFPARTAVLTSVYALANLAAAAFLLFQNRCRLKAVWRAPFSPAVLHRGLRYGIPLALDSLAYWGLTSADRLFLKKYAGLEQLGIYSMGISFGGAALLFQSIFSTVWTPYIFRAIEKNAPPTRLSAT
ncbi:lipopolysaccharide biosynthesis protein, partial [Neisseria gonorrhoeae]